MTEYFNESDYQAQAAFREQPKKVDAPMKTARLKTSLFLLGITYSFWTPLLAYSKISTPPLFSTGMTLQREQPVKIWGDASPDESVTATFENQHVTTKADKSGHWAVVLQPLKPGRAKTLILQGDNKLTYSNVDVGDIWLCSGQSNMIVPIKRSDAPDPELIDADALRIRFYYIWPVPAQVKQVPAHWRSIDHTLLPKVPALPYLFCRAMQKSTNVPVAAIVAACGAAPLETFLSPEAAAKVGCNSNTLPSPFKVSGNYETYLEPLLNYSFRGILWYQGEANANQPSTYANRFCTFIEDWRKKLFTRNVPVYFVQLPEHGLKLQKPVDSLWAELRDAQSLALKMQGIFMVVALDTVKANPAPFHPREKTLIARRLATLASSTRYNSSNNTFPKLASYKIVGKTITVSVSGARKPLQIAKGYKTVTGFQIAGENKVFHWASAEIHGKSITVHSNDVSAPKNVRYGWADNPACNVYSGDQPLAPFRTDKWPTHPVYNPVDLPTAK